MNTYVCFYKGKKVEILAETQLKARDKAAAHFKAKKAWEVEAVLAAVEGKQVTHTPDF